jgi:hypothetical protein
MSDKAERRQWMRHPADPQTSCEVTLEELGPIRAIVVGNVSIGGAELLIDKAVQPGDRIAVELTNPRREVNCRRKSRVIYCQRQKSDVHRIGIAFDSGLSYDELEGLC